MAEMHTSHNFEANRKIAAYEEIAQANAIRAVPRMEMHQEEKIDLVNRPPHYKDGGIEVIDYIEAKKLNYNLGNAVKYISRAGKKDGVSKHQDLEKARWYLAREISHGTIS